MERLPAQKQISGSVSHSGKILSATSALDQAPMVTPARSAPAMTSALMNYPSYSRYRSPCTAHWPDCCSDTC